MARASLLEMGVRRQEGVTPETIAAQRPGGSENPDTSAMGWLAYLIWLNREHAMGRQQPTSRNELRWNEAAIEEMRAALAAEPIIVHLENGDHISVHPKGEYALNRLHVGDIALRWLVERKVALLDAEPNADVLSALELVMEAEQQLVSEFVEIVTHPGSDVPWPSETQWEHEVAAWTRALTPFDLLAIRRAHLEVNMLRINAIAERTKHLAEEKGTTPMAAFHGAMAADMGVQGRVLVRRWSRGELAAMALSKWEVQLRAQAKAEANAPAKT